jgi:hypothetical protein
MLRLSPDTAVIQLDSSPSTMDDNITAEYLAQLQNFRQHDKNREDMVVELVTKYEELRVRFDQQSDDYNNEMESRRMWHKKYNTARKENSEFKNHSVCPLSLLCYLIDMFQDSNPIVFAIIDGDGAVFDDQLLAKGEEGGEEAAHRLHTTLKKYIDDHHPETNAERCSIVVQVVLSLEGLSKKLQACGVVRNVAKELPAFARAFARTQPLFSFVDVGAGKERADHKIRETLRLWFNIAQCKHIFFGPCNDNGYLPFLEPYRRDAVIGPKITLISTTPPEHGFTQLGFKILNLGSIFRSENLPAKPAYLDRSENLPAKAPAYLDTFDTSPTPVRATPLPARASPLPVRSASIPRDENVPLPAPKPAASTPSRTQSAAARSTWATVGKGCGNKVIDIAPKATPGKKYYQVNAIDERIDERLPRIDQGAEKRFNEKVLQHGNLCNAFHLGGSCPEGNYCAYHHGERLTPGEQNVLKGKARGIRCPAGSYCEDVDCTMGHHCKFSGACTFPNCRFQDTHDMDSVSYSTLSRFTRIPLTQCLIACRHEDLRRWNR